MSINPFEAEIREYSDSLPDVDVYEKELQRFLDETPYPKGRVPIGTYESPREVGVIFVVYQEKPSLRVEIYRLVIWRKPE